MIERNTPSPPVGSAIEAQTERTVMAMLSPFLGPPTPQKDDRGQNRSSSSSYGMHTDTANDVFGSAPTPSRPNSIDGPGALAPYPWAWDDMPKPVPAVAEAYKRASGEIQSVGTMPPRSPADNAFANRSPGGYAAPTAPPSLFASEVPRQANVGGSFASPADAAHRERLLQSLSDRKSVV